jgi:transcriptional regulator with XRE-family HTH domain
LPASGSPTVRRRELGVLLRALRTERGWTVEQVAERLACSPSKVSRMETGQRGVNPRDIRDLAAIYELDDERSQQLEELAAEGKQTAWYQHRDLRAPRYVGLEAAAETISDFGLGLVPGLLQTADYARAVLRINLPRLSDDVLEQRLHARLARQQLLVSEGGPRFEGLLEESVLYRPAASRLAMQAQLHRLVELSELPNVAIRVLPFDSGVLPSNNNKFVILTFARPDVPTVVFIEALTGDLYLDRPEDVETYQEAFRIMRTMAASTDRSRQLIAAAAARLDD